MNFDQMMAELRAEYIATIPQKIADIQLHITAKDSEALRNDFHKLKGTGKTYGIPEVTDVGLVVEKMFLDKKPRAIDAALIGIELLKKIHTARLKHTGYDLSSDAQFRELQSL